jgi:hypothetical protein
VASLLPASLIVEQGRELGIREIVVLNETHEHTYRHVAERLDGVRVSRLSANPLLAALAVARRFIAARRHNHRVVFFHECCWPAFDLLVAAIKPRGAYFPQVFMSPGYERIEISDWQPAPGWKARLRRLVLSPVIHNFEIYRSPKLSGETGYGYYLSMRQYPETVDIHPVASRRGGPPAVAGAPSPRSVLFVVGVESMPDETLRRVYARLIAAAQAGGYAVAIKDHPIYVLGIDCDSCERIEPTIPVELLGRDFDFAIGIASTGLLAAGRRKISIVRGLAEMSAELQQMRVDYLRSLPGGNAVEFADTLVDVEALLRSGVAQ